MNDKKFRKKQRQKEWMKSKNSAERKLKKLLRKKQKKQLKAKLSARVIEELDAVNSINLTDTSVESSEVSFPLNTSSEEKPSIR